MAANPGPARAARQDRRDREITRRSADDLPEDDLRARVQQVGVRQQRFERHVAGRLGVDAAGLLTLDHLISAGSATPTQLARRLEVSTAAMTLVLNRLEDQGHIRRDRHPSDGRKVVVTPSQASADRAHQLVLPLIEGVERLIEALSDQDRATVQRFLDQLVAVYDDSGIDAASA